VVRLIGPSIHVDLFLTGQYWAWSRSRICYFSKPRCWLDHLAGRAHLRQFGSCIRRRRCVLFGTSLLIYAVAHLIYDAGFVYAACRSPLGDRLLFSARIISTDCRAVLWTLALLAYLKLYLEATCAGALS